MSEVCPLSLGLGRQDALAILSRQAGLLHIRQQRQTATLAYADRNEACRAAFIGGYVALAWSRFSDEVRQRVCARYPDALTTWQDGAGYRLPAEFVIVEAVVHG